MSAASAAHVTFVKKDDALVKRFSKGRFTELTNSGILENGMATVLNREVSDYLGVQARDVTKMCKNCMHGTCRNSAHDDENITFCAFALYDCPPFSKAVGEKKQQYLFFMKGPVITGFNGSAFDSLHGGTKFAILAIMSNDISSFEDKLNKIVHNYYYNGIPAPREVEEKKADATVATATATAAAAAATTPTRKVTTGLGFAAMVKSNVNFPSLPVASAPESFKDVAKAERPISDKKVEESVSDEKAAKASAQVIPMVAKASAPVIPVAKICSKEFFGRIQKSDGTFCSVFTNSDAEKEKLNEQYDIGMVLENGDLVEIMMRKETV
jgi:hypothetical protein